MGCGEEGNIKTKVFIAKKVHIFMRYKHTQRGYLIYFALFFVILLFGIVLSQTEFNIAILAFMFLIVLLLASFSTLNVSVDESYLRIKFGWGIYLKSFLLKEIVSAKAVKNHWYYGWGIRFWFWPRMCIYNVSGFDAVEIKLKDNRIFRIGTDEPRELERVIFKSIK